MRFTPSFLAEVKSRIPLDTLVMRYVNLRHKTGGEHTGLCPFHNEKTPSFTVSAPKGFYHCFGCGAHGDHVSFLMEHAGLSYLDAVKDLANQAGMQLPDPDPQMDKRMKRQATLHDVMQMAAEYYQAQLQSRQGLIAREYIQKRRITKESIDRFGIGYAPNSRDGLQNYLLARDVTAGMMKACGLTSQKEGGNAYDRFRDRLMFPIWDTAGKVVAFGGRILTSDTNAPKYLNSPETEIFHKGRMLYGFHLARQAAHKQAQMLVGEGYMDVVALYQAGIEHAVAPNGTAITEEQLKLLWGVVPEPTLCLDGDAAGKRAMQKAAHVALPHLSPTSSLKFCQLPEGMDPDDVLQSQGVGKLMEVLGNTTPLSEALWNMATAGKTAHTPEQKAALEAELMQKADTIAHPNLKTYYRRYFNEQLWQSQKRKTTKTPYKKGGDFNKKAQPVVNVPTIVVPSVKEQAAATLLCVVLKQPILWQEADVEDALTSIQWLHEYEQKLADALCEMLVNDATDSKALYDALAQQGMLEAIKLSERLSKLHKDEVEDVNIARRHFMLAVHRIQCEALMAEYKIASARSKNDEEMAKAWQLKQELDRLTFSISQEREEIAQLIEG